MTTAPTVSEALKLADRLEAAPISEIVFVNDGRRQVVLLNSKTVDYLLVEDRDFIVSALRAIQPGELERKNNSVRNSTRKERFSMNETQETELIAALEKATGPDRVIDVAIFNLLKPTEYRRQMDTGKVDPPPYTLSFAAARTLIPNCHSYALGDLNANNSPWCCITRDSDGEDFDAAAATEILALCIAGLKCRMPNSVPEAS